MFARIAQQVLLVYCIATIVKNMFGTKSPVTPIPSSGQGVSPSADGVDPFTLPPTQYAPLWQIGTPIDIYVQVTTVPDPVYALNARERNLPRFVWKDVKLGDWNDQRVEEFVIDVPRASEPLLPNYSTLTICPQSVQHNGTLWMHVTLVKDHANPNLHESGFNPDSVYYYSKPLTRYLKKPKTIVEKKLLGGTESQSEPEQDIAEEPAVWLSYWHPNVTLTVVGDAGVLAAAQITGPAAKYYGLHPSKRDETGKVAFMYPIVYPNDFWLLRSHMTPVNTTTPKLPLRISYHAISQMKFNLFSTFTHGFDEAANKGGGAATADLDEIKRMLIETNLWLLITTAIVSVLHMLFEVLAFTNDVQHWRKRDELVGVSVRTILVNVFVQIITGLYLWDNAEETSWMILFSQVVGVLIEAWKITKAVDIALIPAPAGSTLPYKLQITDKHVLSEDEKKTKEYDQLAFRYVSYVAIPLLAGYTVYSLLYQSHKGWYSFVITTLSSFVYMFGFVQLVPQLIINYKLKSVAHMPWKAMVYKTLSTVVDDFFAFIIKMPWLHRLACFRDDVVFLILLYQRWIYRVDYQRANEYGQVGEAEDKDKTVQGSNKKE
ncbi:hypothetical protein FRB99_005430 [Tulasnella sp. 403]|nr:hypothetical protein FRB99_005430 [Tulasnella sp. 403]